MQNMEIKTLALQTIQLEADSVAGLQKFINNTFEEVVQLMHQCKGRLVISGIGKSAIIAQKIVATLNSTGTPSLYMHAADAIHGDLGMITPLDVVMVISKSGNSPEIKVLVPLIKNFGNTVIGMVGNTESFLAKHSHYILDTTVDKEACPNNLAPTSSTTAQMVMGDTLAVCLMHLNRFSGDDFAKFHPGGTLGKKLFLRVSDLVADNPKPSVKPSTKLLPDTIIEMTAKRLGATAVINDDNTVFGIITDGDLRRMLERNQTMNELVASDICSRNPKWIEPGALAVEALDKLRQFDITHLIVSTNNQYVGILHLHDLIKEGLL
ncbi:MAG TPA: KpsF/GutQ family sugar-phosphate isomerase [Phnomibacter sp.]|nr:KpsF/GutQ family sugar-phosphate isomerase [Phnomibacter sp.]